jgi:acyl-CoA reductase-like NAD-dependent aldehyde dehydrogenase
MTSSIEGRVLIGGSWERAEAGTYDIINPATEEVAGKAPQASIEQVRRAARAAREAFERGPWPRMSGAERSALLHQAAAAFEREKAPLVPLTIAETGALPIVAETQQVGAVGLRLAKYAGLATVSPQEPLAALPFSGPRGSGVNNGMAVREPVGVVACITPYNFPMTNCAGKIGPALACGNTVVVKPAPVDPLGVAELCRIVDSVLPPGVLNFVCGSAPEVGMALCDSPDVDMISFTGSTAVGAQIQAGAGRRMQRTLLELGGKSANIIFADADRQKALAHAAQVWTFHSGQICIAGTRVLVERGIYDEFTAQLAAMAPRLKVGRPGDEGVVVGPLVNAAARERVERYVAKGIEEGATLAAGGKRPADLPTGYFMQPTLFTNVRNDMAIAREEIFGPVIVAIPFDSDAEAIAIANDSDFGLYGYVWSADTARALQVASGMRTGTVLINGAPMHGDAPFGGYKLSGIGRDGGRYALNAYSELKYIGWAS